MLKAAVFAFLLTFVTQSELVEQCRYVDSKKMATVAYISQTFKRPFHEVVEIYDAAVSSSARYGLSVSTILAVIATESSFNPLVESKSGANGLMQITIQSGKKVTKNVQENVDNGTELLLHYVQRYGNLAHQVYNVGWKGYKSGRRAVDYERKILSYRAVFERSLK